MPDRNELELVKKVHDLVAIKFNGNYKRAFDYYSTKRSNSGTIDREELVDLLKDALIGNFVTRGIWADGVMEKLDKNRDGFISFSELESLK